MVKYYTRACNFYYGSQSRELVKKKQTLPLNGNNNISFNQVEIFSKNQKKISSKIISLKKLELLSKNIKYKVLKDLKNITTKKKIVQS